MALNKLAKQVNNNNKSAMDAHTQKAFSASCLHESRVETKVQRSSEKRNKKIDIRIGRKYIKSCMQFQGVLVYSVGTNKRVESCYYGGITGKSYRT